MLGPFTVDAYLPAFPGIAADTGATAVQMQQTLSAYLLGFAFMNLFHGALADSFGRRPVILVGTAVFTLSSVGCALAQDITTLITFRAIQGLATGAGVVVSRAIIRDLFAPADAQRMMSQVTLFFGVAPAIAPLFGGWLYVLMGWTAVFWMLAVLGAGLWFANWSLLPETLGPAQRRAFEVSDLFAGYREMAQSPRFVLLCMASAIPFNGMFLYVLASPTFLGVHLGLAPTEFFWFFLLTVAGIMAGAWLSGRLAGRVERRTQIRLGFALMTSMAIANVLLNLLVEPRFPWAVLPIACFTLGWALVVPVVTILVLDLFPHRRGMASSLHAVIGSLANALVAGVLVPLVMHSMLALAWAALGMGAVGLVSWAWVTRRWPETGQGKG